MINQSNNACLTCQISFVGPILIIRRLCIPRSYRFSATVSGVWDLFAASLAGVIVKKKRKKITAI